MVAAALAYLLQSFGLDASRVALFAPILVITATALAALGLLITGVVLRPLKKLRKGAGQIARGNFGFKIHPGKITKEDVRNADELSRLVLIFEAMRRKVVELQSNLDKMIEAKTTGLRRVNDELVEKEAVLQRANAKLVGQSEELQKINDELSSSNKELSEANAKLQQLDKMKTDFILIASHELRTPIQPILGSVQLAEKGLISSEEAWKVIISESKRLTGVANYILDVSRIESGTFAYDMKPVRIAQLIESITYSSSKFATEEGGVIPIIVDLDSNDVQVLGDKERLIQAFSNIINNAVKFAKNGTITIKTRGAPEEGLVEIMIVDNGPGIPAEILPVLFNKFVTKTHENERGTGLGLFITKAIIEAHNGSIKAENNKAGRGATFTVSLPIHVLPVPPVTAAE